MASGIVKGCRTPADRAQGQPQRAAGVRQPLTISDVIREHDRQPSFDEGAGANIFILLEDGKLHTPEPDCFLDGITKRTVMALAKAHGYEIVQRHIKPEGASEVFLTGTAVEVTPVREIGEYSFTPGAVTKTLMEDYDAEVRREVPATLTAA